MTFLCDIVVLLRCEKERTQGRKAMAEAFLEEIYREAELIYKLKLAAEYARIHDELHMGEICSEIFQPLCEVCKAYLLQDKAKGIRLWNEIRFISYMSFQRGQTGIGSDKSLCRLFKECDKEGYGLLCFSAGNLRGNG